MTKAIKNFQATYRPAGGLIVVVIVMEEDGCVAFFSANPKATAVEILGGDGGPRGIGADEQGRQGGVGRRPALGEEHRQQHRLFQHEPVDV